MKLFTITLSILLIFTMTLTAAQTPEMLTVKMGQQKVDKMSGLRIKFVSVVEDSRCPVDVDCIWAGNAKVRLKLKKKNGAWETVELNTNLDKQEIEFGGYSIKISALTPTPNNAIDNLVQRLDTFLKTLIAGAGQAYR